MFACLKNYLDYYVSIPANIVYKNNK